METNVINTSDIEFRANFVGFNKIARLAREIIITEKIDGTNAQIFIPEAGEIALANSIKYYPFLCGSRSRWIFPEKDNHGFAKWAYERADEIVQVLGPGRHFGEWWGCGINRGYGLKDKRFSLFNVTKWQDAVRTSKLPEWLNIVPVIMTAPSFDTYFVDLALEILKDHGSLAAPGYGNPEGVVIYHTQGNVMFKKTLEKDNVGKGNS